MPFSESEQTKILHAFKEKATNLHCPMCNHRDWVLAEHYTPLTLQDMKGFVIGGPLIPIT
jgi:hypothetical protein